MKLFLIRHLHAVGYDVYYGAVVAAKNEEAAKQIHPDGRNKVDGTTKYFDWASDPNKVTAKYIGTTNKYKAGEIVLVDFVAG